MTGKKQQIQPESTVKRDPDMLASKMDNEYVMMSVENGEYYGLDEIGSRIWELIEDEINVTNLVETLTEEYDVSYDQCQADVLGFLNELAGKKLVIVTNS